MNYVLSKISVVMFASVFAITMQASKYTAKAFGSNDSDEQALYSKCLKDVIEIRKVFVEVLNPTVDASCAIETSLDIAPEEREKADAYLKKNCSKIVALQRDLEELNARCSSFVEFKQAQDALSLLNTVVSRIPERYRQYCSTEK